MFAVERNTVGHFCLGNRCEYFRHTDLCTTEDWRDTVYCISSVGLLPAQYPNSWGVEINGKLYERINASSLFEVMVFDKTGDNPWEEVEVFCSDDLQEIKAKHNEWIDKYMKIMTRRF